MESRGVTIRELDGRAKWAIVTLVAIAILDAVAVWFDIECYDLLDRIINNGSTPTRSTSWQRSSRSS